MQKILTTFKNLYLDSFLHQLHRSWFKQNPIHKLDNSRSNEGSFVKKTPMRNSKSNAKVKHYTNAKGKPTQRLSIGDKDHTPIEIRNGNKTSLTGSNI